jgi:hypothetical protein
MKSAAIVVLLLISVFLADRVVRLENQRYALYVDICKRDPANPLRQGDCLKQVQTRTSWFWHLYYAMTEPVPVPLLST